MKAFTVINISFITLGISLSQAQDPQESDYYTITPFEAPEGEVIETSGITLMDDGKIAICTRRGRIWTIDNAFEHPAKPAKWNVFAEYLHEPLSLSSHDGWLYAVQRPEITRMKDEDGDGRVDIFETVSDKFGINGNYHEYNFGSRFDSDGNMWCTLCLTGSGGIGSMFRGWAITVNTDGTTTPVVCGIRSPGGVGFNAEGDVFYTDNQGPWNGSSSLKWLKPGSFQGNPSGNMFHPFAEGFTGPRPVEPDHVNQGSIMVARENIPSYVPPAVVLPHGRVGQSPTGIEPDKTGGKFGPFEGQTFVAEQTHSKVSRVFLEKVNGLYQGAVFPFLEGFQSGNIGLLLTDDGVMFTGGSNRGWGARGGKTHSFERVNWTGKVPFEIHEMRVQPEGFELTFTQPINPDSAVDASFSCEAFTYEYGSKYGSPEIEKLNPTVTVTDVAKDGMSLKIKVEPFTKGHVHALFSKGLRSSENIPLLHQDAYYTLNEIPSK